MGPIKLPSMTKSEIDQAIRQQFLCRIVFISKDGPYIAPFQYVFVDNHLYFHFTDYGNKIGFLKEGKQVCVEIENYKPDFSEYAFLILNGTLKIVEDKDERKKAIEKISEIGKAKLSPNFLYAHGFNSKDGWSTLNADKEIIIVKLDKISSQNGLKSP
jgi:hypothetical protein